MTVNFNTNMETDNSGEEDIMLYSRKKYEGYSQYGIIIIIYSNWTLNKYMFTISIT